ncbi:hypothetical protein AB9F45_38435, partial [Rhizobium leguminosarum]|uniref:hypothetical protein n=1 Tax=Rhizobium leguminosarum TaxID=384 RepID=UPI003F9922F2
PIDLHVPDLFCQIAQGGIGVVFDGHRMARPDRTASAFDAKIAPIDPRLRQDVQQLHRYQMVHVALK